MFSSQLLRNAIDHKQALPVKSHVHVVTSGNALRSQMTDCAFSSGQFLFQQYIYFMSVLLHNMSTTFCPTVSCVSFPFPDLCLQINQVVQVQ